MIDEEQGLVVTFIPQVWIDDYAMEIKPSGDTSWGITTREFEELTGLVLSNYSDPQDLDLETNEGDTLQHSSNAPEWVKEHTGPFRILCEEITLTTTNRLTGR